MKQKDKTEAYDKALEKAKSWYQDAQIDFKKSLETLFPELKESEDENMWSDEDERLCKCLIEDQEEALDKVRNNMYGHSEIISDLKEMYHERIDWLKSLKGKVQPQNTWKPSDEQMDTLWFYAEQNNYAGAVLTSLYNDLKKLKEE